MYAVNRIKREALFILAERCSTVEAANEIFSREIGLASHSSLHKWRTKKQKQKQRLGMKLDRDGPIIVHSSKPSYRFQFPASCTI